MGVRSSLLSAHASRRRRVRDRAVRGARIDRCVVVIPAHNECETLGAAVNAVRRAAAVVAVPVRVVVVLDACTDDSASQVPPDVEVRNILSRNVGRARSAGFADAEARSDTWYATTDADSRVPEQWLEWQLEIAETGYDAVFGTVEVADWTDWPADASERFADHYAPTYRPAPDRFQEHGHVHGANLGVRASVYHQIGGFAPLDRDEDVDLAGRLAHLRRPIAWSGSMPVITSPRRVGRAPAGFATSLPAIVGVAP